MLFAVILINLLFVSTLLAICFLWWWSWSRRIVRTTLPLQRYKPARLFTEHVSIALVCDEYNAAVKRLHQGILTQLQTTKKNITYHLEVFEGNKNNRTTRLHLETIIKKQFDCIATAGLFVTQIAQDTITSSQLPCPIVFGMVSELENHIIQHPTAHKWTTGILSQRDLAAELSHIMYLTPRITNALIVCPEHEWRWLEKDIEQLSNFLKTQDSTVKTYRLSDKNIAPVISQLTSINFLIILRHAVTPDQISELAASCQHFGVTLYATDIDDVTHGAAVGTGGGEENIGTVVGQKIMQIIEHKTPVHHIAITEQQTPHRVRLNQETALNQAILLSKDDLFVIGRGEMVRN